MAKILPFRPSVHSSSYGEGVTISVGGSGTPAPTAPAPAPSGGTSTSSYLEYVPLLREFVMGSDPRTEAARLESKVKDLRKKLRTAKGPLKLLYEEQLRVAESKLEAARAQAGEAQFAAESAKSAQILGNTLLIAGTVATVAVTVAALLWGLRQYKAAQGGY